MTRADFERAAHERFARSANQRAQVKVSLLEGLTPYEIDSPDRADKHLSYLGVSASAADIVQMAAAARARGEQPRLERLIGTDNLLSALFLTKGAACCRAVGAIGARGRLFGTGFLIGGGLLMTNNHVIERASDAEECFVAFNFEDAVQGGVGPEHRFDLRPRDFFMTSVELDYTVIAVADVARGASTTIPEFGQIPLNPSLGKVLLGEPLNIIQHPNGARKQVAIRQNRFTALLDNHVHYETDTNPGSSGSPVFNDLWDVVALHHSVVPEKNGEGWLGNEGIRISAIVTDLWRRADAAAKGRLEAALAPASPVDRPTEKRVQLDSPSEWPRGSESSPELSRGPTFEVTVSWPGGGLVRVPIHVTIDDASGATQARSRSEVAPLRKS